MAASPLGTRWVSKNFGSTWAEDGVALIAIGCLSSSPDGRLRPFQPNDGGPWVIGVSDDFGLS